jgi:hypothetical protein
VEKSYQRAPRGDARVSLLSCPPDRGEFGSCCMRSEAVRISLMKGPRAGRMSAIVGSVARCRSSYRTAPLLHNEAGNGLFRRCVRSIARCSHHRPCMRYAPLQQRSANVVGKHAHIDSLHHSHNNDTLPRDHLLRTGYTVTCGNVPLWRGQTQAPTAPRSRP